jgi:transporter family-2 protein
LLAILAGAMLPTQAAINARLARALGSPIWSAAVSGLILTLALVVVGLVAVRAGPRTTELGSLPWWAWLGGLCGTMVLGATTAVAPRLGAGTMIAMVVAGQILCAVALDHFGLLGLETQTLSLKRLAAVILVMAGASLMR